jgi:hypothetical protein
MPGIALIPPPSVKGIMPTVEEFGPAGKKH